LPSASKTAPGTPATTAAARTDARLELELEEALRRCAELRSELEGAYRTGLEERATFRAELAAAEQRGAEGAYLDAASRARANRSRYRGTGRTALDWLAAELTDRAAAVAPAADALPEPQFPPEAVEVLATSLAGAPLDQCPAYMANNARADAEQGLAALTPMWQRARHTAASGALAALADRYLDRLHRQETIHTHCEGHALCDLVSELDATRARVRNTPEGT
jgi:hypothetical protein